MTMKSPPPLSPTPPEASRPLLDADAKQLGLVLNLSRAVAVSPPALEVYLGQSGALGKGSFWRMTQAYAGV